MFGQCLIDSSLTLKKNFDTNATCRLSPLAEFFTAPSGFVFGGCGSAVWGERLMALFAVFGRTDRRAILGVVDATVFLPAKNAEKDSAACRFPFHPKSRVCSDFTLRLRPVAS